MEQHSEGACGRNDAEAVLEAWNASVVSGAASSAAETGECTYRAIFFDLDGTLLPMELEQFLGAYFSSIAQFVARHGFDAQAFSAGLKAGTKAMAEHPGTYTNHDAYWETFFQHVDRDALNWEETLIGFYEDDFGRIGEGFESNPAATRAIEALVAKGYPLVLTTMPMFPQRAVEWRLSWAGVDAQHFSRLTTFENSTAVKPKLSYYAENLAACGLSGADVLMVGNNTVEDLVAMQLGTDAFLVTDCLLDPVGYDLSTVKHGTLEEFAAWVETLPPCENPATGIETGVVSRDRVESILAASHDASSATPGAEA